MLESTKIGDTSNNKYANVIKELANGLAAWSGILLLPFVLYFLYINSNASLFSFKAILVILGCEIFFTILVRIANLILSYGIGIFFVPFILKGIIRPIQNIQATVMLIFSITCLIGAWYFAKYIVNYMYS